MGPRDQVLQSTISVVSTTSTDVDYAQKMFEDALLSPRFVTAAGLYSRGAMKSVVLTRGIYRVDDATEQRILSAMESRAQYVEIDADVIGDGARMDSLKLFLQHIIAIIDDGDEVHEDFPLVDFANVRRINFGATN